MSVFLCQPYRLLWADVCAGVCHKYKVDTSVYHLSCVYCIEIHALVETAAVYWNIFTDNMLTQRSAASLRCQRTLPSSKRGHTFVLSWFSANFFPSASGICSWRAAANSPGFQLTLAVYLRKSAVNPHLFSTYSNSKPAIVLKLFLFIFSICSYLSWLWLSVGVDSLGENNV